MCIAYHSIADIAHIHDIDVVFGSFLGSMKGISLLFLFVFLVILFHFQFHFSKEIILGCGMYIHDDDVH